MDETEEIAINQEEYEIYTSVCKTHILQFNQPRITVNDFTGIYPVNTKIGENRWSAPFIGKGKYLCARQPEILKDFVEKNKKCYRLEKKFYIENGYQFLSERILVESLKKRDVITFSRVGFTYDKILGLVNIVCSNCCYYLLFQKGKDDWQLVGLGEMIWTVCRTS